MKNEIYDYEKKRLERYKRIIARFGRNGEIALQFLDRLASLGLSTARLSKVAGHLPALLRAVDFDLENASRRDVERVVAWINRQPYREWTKHGLKMAVRNLVQYATANNIVRVKCPLDKSLFFLPKFLERTILLSLHFLQVYKNFIRRIKNSLQRLKF